MTILTPKDLEENKLLPENSNEWVMYLHHTGTPYEAFSDVPFLTSGQAGQLSEFGTLLILFTDEESALVSFEEVRGKNKSHLHSDSPCIAVAAIMHDGIIVADTETN